MVISGRGNTMINQQNRYRAPPTHKRAAARLDYQGREGLSDADNTDDRKTDDKQIAKQGTSCFGEKMTN
jgi:hypothetical protein